MHWWIEHWQLAAVVAVVSLFALAMLVGTLLQLRKHHVPTSVGDLVWRWRSGVTATGWRVRLSSRKNSVRVTRPDGACASFEFWYDWRGEGPAILKIDETTHWLLDDVSVPISCEESLHVVSLATAALSFLGIEVR